MRSLSFLTIGLGGRGGYSGHPFINPLNCIELTRNFVHYMSMRTTNLMGVVWSKSLSGWSKLLDEKLLLNLSLFSQSLNFLYGKTL